MEDVRGYWHKSGCDRANHEFSVICDCDIELSKIIAKEREQAAAEEIKSMKQRFHEPIEHDGAYVSISVIDEAFDGRIAQLQSTQSGEEK